MTKANFFFVFALSAFLGIQSLSSAQVRSPKVSPAAKISQTVGVTDIEIAYCRPSVGGRKIWGELVPFGQVWRAGANEATKITFSDKVKIGGKEIPAGAYGLFALPNDDKWVVILSKNPDQWGSGTYAEGDDVVRVEAKVEKGLNPATEMMSFSFPKVSDAGTTVELKWEKLSVSFDVEVMTADLVEASITGAVKEAEKAAGTYVQAANYYLSKNKSTDEALVFIDKALGIDPNNVRAYLTKSQLLASKGSYSQAIAAAEKCNEMAAKITNKRTMEYYQGLCAKNIADWKAKL